MTDWIMISTDDQVQSEQQFLGQSQDTHALEQLPDPQSCAS